MSAGRNGLRVAFQGERGAFSEEAAIQLLGESVTTVPRPTFEALFSAVEEGAADAILAPIENSLAGSVHRTYDLLLESKLQVMGEVVISIEHCLIGVPGAQREDIRVVESHPVALAQCEGFFRAHPRIKRVASEDTAGSVREVIRAGDPSRGAIAGRRAAEVHGGCILQKHLEDHCENYTRFLLLSPEASAPPAADKLSLVVRLTHQPGALHRALGPFARRNINLMKIESRPLVGHPWQYCFYIDLQAAAENPEVTAALADLRRAADQVRVLGWYPSARPVQKETRNAG